MRKLFTQLMQAGLGNLPSKTLESWGRFIAVSLGSFFSPTWPLLNQFLGPHLNLDAVLNAQTMKPALADFMLRLHAHHGQLAREILPQMILCLLISVLFIVLCNQAGALAVRLLIQRGIHFPKAE